MAGHRWQYGAFAVYAGYLRLKTHTHNIYYLLIFHCNNGCTNEPHYYGIPTLLIMLIVVGFDYERSPRLWYSFGVLYVHYVSPTVCVTVRCLGNSVVISQLVCCGYRLPWILRCHAKSGVPCMTDCDVTIRFACVDVQNDCRALWYELF